MSWLQISFVYLLGLLFITRAPWNITEGSGLAFPPTFAPSLLCVTSLGPSVHHRSYCYSSPGPFIHHRQFCYSSPGPFIHHRQYCYSSPGPFIHHRQYCYSSPGPFIHHKQYCYTSLDLLSITDNTATHPLGLLSITNNTATHPLTFYPSQTILLHTLDLLSITDNIANNVQSKHTASHCVPPQSVLSTRCLISVEILSPVALLYCGIGRCGVTCDLQLEGAVS